MFVLPSLHFGIAAIFFSSSFSKQNLKDFDKHFFFQLTLESTFLKLEKRISSVLKLSPCLFFEKGVIIGIKENLNYLPRSMPTIADHDICKIIGILLMNEFVSLQVTYTSIHF